MSSLDQCIGEALQCKIKMYDRRWTPCGTKTLLGAVNDH